MNTVDAIKLLSQDTEHPLGKYFVAKEDFDNYYDQMVNDECQTDSEFSLDEICDEVTHEKEIIGKIDGRKVVFDLPFPSSIIIDSMSLVIYPRSIDFNKYQILSGANYYVTIGGSRSLFVSLLFDALLGKKVGQKISIYDDYFVLPLTSYNLLPKIDTSLLKWQSCCLTTSDITDIRCVKLIIKYHKSKHNYKYTYQLKEYWTFIPHTVPTKQVCSNNSIHFIPHINGLSPYYFISLELRFGNSTFLESVELYYNDVSIFYLEPEDVMINEFGKSTFISFSLNPNYKKFIDLFKKKTLKKMSHGIRGRFIDRIKAKFSDSDIQTVNVHYIIGNITRFSSGTGGHGFAPY